MFQRTEHLYITVLADIIVITCAEEALAQVVCCQIMFGIATVTAGSGTVDDDEVGTITILRSLSHQFDFVVIRFKLRVSFL